MKYQSKRFTVPVGSRDSKGCEHAWLDKWGKCVQCGAVPAKPESS